MSLDVPAALTAARAEILERRAGLQRQVDALAQEQALTTHDDEHDPDGAPVAVARAQVQGLLAGTQRDLDALDRAAERLRARTYGWCLRCGGPIAAVRLEALPAAETCIRCVSGSRSRTS